MTYELESLGVRWAPEFARARCCHRQVGEDLGGPMSLACRPLLITGRWDQREPVALLVSFSSRRRRSSRRLHRLVGDLRESLPKVVPKGPFAAAS